MLGYTVVTNTALNISHSCCKSVSSWMFHATFTLRSRLMELFPSGIFLVSGQKEKKTMTWNTCWFKTFSLRVRDLTCAHINFSLANSDKDQA